MEGKEGGTRELTFSVPSFFQLVELAVCRSNLSVDVKTQRMCHPLAPLDDSTSNFAPSLSVCVQSLDTLANLLPTAQLKTSKILIQIFSSLCPLIFRYLSVLFLLRSKPTSRDWDVDPLFLPPKAGRTDPTLSSGRLSPKSSNASSDGLPSEQARTGDLSRRVREFRRSSSCRRPSWFRRRDPTIQG